MTDPYRLLFEHVGHMVCTLDLEGRFTAVNAAGTRLTGYSEAELLGRPAADLIAAELRETAVAQFRRRLRAGADAPPETSILVTREGRRVPIEITSTIITGDAGEAEGVLGLIRDVSERRAAANALLESEQRFGALLDAAPDGILISNAAGTIVLVNAQTESLFGYRRDELVGAPAELVLPGGGDVARRKDGSEFPVDVTLSPLETEGGVLMLAAVRDVTERRRDEEVLRESEERFRTAFDDAAIGMALVALDGSWLQVNRALTDIVGYSREELLGRTFQDITHPDDLEADLAYVRRMLDGEIQTYQMEKRYLNKCGDVVWVLLSVSLVRARDGSPLYFISQIQDITARKHAHEALARSKAQLAEAQQIAQVASWEREPTGAASWSDEVYAVFGLDPASGPPDEKRLLALVHPDDLDRVLATMEEARSALEPLSIEYRIIRPDGKVRWIQSRGRSVTGPHGTGRRVTAQDITERKEAEQRLAEAEQRYRILVEQLPIGMYVRPLDLTLPNIYASPQVEPMLGYPAAEWERNPDLLATIVHPDDRERVLGGAKRVRTTGEPLRDEYRYVAPDGRVVWVQDETYVVNDEQGQPAFVQGFLLDITERKQAEAERDRLREDLHHAQKLEAIGRLAGGVAHDFNNMLTAIKGYSELLLGSLDERSPLRSHAAQIKRAAEQASALPRQLLAFSRKQALQPEVTDLSVVVAGVGDLLRRLISESVRLHLELPRPVLACVDAGQLEQVLVNLALNARDAMPGGGTLTISTREAEVDDALASEHDARPGRYSVIGVYDTGHGIDTETKAKIFEPFFTTKNVGSGSGLGLASVYGTVSQSGGFIRVQSEPGHGTRFDLYFPADAVDGSAHAAGRSGGPSVLLAEDEEIVRDLAVSVLENAGFEVRTAANGREAAALYEQDAGSIDVVVTDMVMPELGGLGLAERILERSPEMPIVYMSGYTDDRPSADDGAAFLQKPFSADALVEAVKHATAIRESTRVSGTVRAARGTTCVVADDHPAVLDAISHFLETQGVTVVGRAGDATEALREIDEHKPRVALLDLAMTPLDGLELTEEALRLSPETRSVIYTGHRDPSLADRALAAGAAGVVLKEAPLAELIQALTFVAGGGTYIDQQLVPEPAPDVPRLTPREQEILGHLAAGKTNDKVAQELGISAETVQSHVHNAMGKLDADTRTEAVAIALRRSLIA